MHGTGSGGCKAGSFSHLIFRDNWIYLCYIKLIKVLTANKKSATIKSYRAERCWYNEPCLKYNFNAFLKIL